MNRLGIEVVILITFFSKHSPTYENDYVSMDQFDAVGGDEGATKKRLLLKTFALRSGSEADNQ